MRTSLEIVSRSAAELSAAVNLITTRYPRIDTVNVPDPATCDCAASTQSSTSAPASYIGNRTCAHAISTRRRRSNRSRF